MAPATRAWFSVPAAFALLLTVGGASVGSAHAQDRPQELGRGTPVLPPGLWFRTGHYEDWALDAEPEAPRVAVIAGVYDTDGRAARAAGAATRADLSPGFPWIVAASDLRLVDRCDSGLVVVSGLFRNADEANQWVAASVARYGHAVVPLADDDDGSCGASVPSSVEITHVEPEEALVAAWTPEVLAALESELGRAVSPDDLSEREEAPRCRVEGGSVFSFDPSRDAVGSFGRRWAPVRCGDDIAFAPVEQTRRGTVFEARDDGTTFVHQITDVSCDVAHFDTWAWTSRTGRQQIAGHPPTFFAGCPR